MTIAKLKAVEPAESPALPWKNSLLTKEEPEALQNPLNYFADVVKDYDTFATIYDDIVDSREEGRLLKYFKAPQDEQLLSAFMVVQDPRGANWICPVFADADIDQSIHPLNFINKGEYPAMHEVLFGNIKMSLDDYISACSRGFENAGRLLLGDEAVKLNIGFSLIGVFYFYPSVK